MSTPEDRLRQKAEALKAEMEMDEKRRHQEESRRRADLQQRARTVSTEAQTWLARAQELVAATRMLVPLHLDTDLPGDDLGFELTIGTAVFRAVLGADGWHVAKTSPADLYHAHTLPTDLAVNRDTVLERMVERGLEDLVEGRVAPAPEWGR